MAESSIAPKNSNDTFDIVPLDDAKLLASSWLTSLDNWEEDSDSVANFISRPPRLGLGAKFLSHSKANTSIVALLERRVLKEKARDKSRYEGEKDSQSSKESENSDGESRSAIFSKRSLLLSQSIGTTIKGGRQKRKKS